MQHLSCITAISLNIFYLCFSETSFRRWHGPHHTFTDVPELSGTDLDDCMHITEDIGKPFITLIGGSKKFTKLHVKLYGYYDPDPTDDDTCIASQLVPDLSLIVMSEDNFKRASDMCMPFCGITEMCTFKNIIAGPPDQYQYECNCPGETNCHNVAIVLPHRQVTLCHVELDDCPDGVFP